MEDLSHPRPQDCGVHPQPIARFEPLPQHHQQPIATATAADALFIAHLQRRFSNQIGFIPTAALAWYLDHACITIARENDQPAGYLLGRPAYKWQPLLRPIFQAAVAMDAQRRHHGLALLARVEQQAREAGQIGLQANCAADLEANEFWKAAGFVAICHLQPLNARKRDVICWRKPLVKKLPLWFACPPKRAGYQAHSPRVGKRRRR